MKKFLKNLFTAALLLCIAPSLFAQRQPVRIACVGNSITYGYGVSPRNKNSYPAQLQAMLGDGYKVENFGVSGRTLLRKGNLPYWKEQAYHEALVFNPNIVFIMLGTNDSKKINRPFFNEFEQDYSDLIDSFRALPVHPRVIMLLPIATFYPDSNEIYDPVIVHQIIPMCEEVAWKKQVEMINLHPMFLGSNSWMLFDKIHPDPLGDQQIAQRLYEQLQLHPIKSEGIFSSIQFSKTVTSYHGYRCANFKFEGHDCKVVKPYVQAAGKPWIWRARFWGNEPQAEIALLERGFYLVYCDVAELYGNKECIDIWNKFYDYVHDHLKLNAKAVMEGYSRGGAYIYDWAAVNPGKIACMYADAPVLDFKSWPGGRGKSEGSRNDWGIFKKDYGFTGDSEALAFKGNPIDKVKEIVAGHYPMLHVVGDADTLVPVAENTAPFAEKIKTLGGNIQVIHKPGAYHHPHSLADPAPIVNFILRVTGHAVNLAAIPAPGAEFRSAAAGWTGNSTWYDQADNIQHTLDSLKRVDILMMGNSITEGIGMRSLAAYSPGQKPFQDQFEHYRLAVAAISGDRIQNLMWRLENYNYNACKPKLVVITIGVNNFLDDITPEKIVAGMKKLITVAKKRLPDTKILLIGPLPAGDTPVSGLRKKYDAVHQGIASLGDHRRVFIYKYNSKMLLPDGNLNPRFYGGDIHLQAAGYVQWAKYLHKQMEEEHLLQ